MLLIRVKADRINITHVSNQACTLPVFLIKECHGHVGFIWPKPWNMWTAVLKIKRLWMGLPNNILPLLMTDYVMKIVQTIVQMLWCSWSRAKMCSCVNSHPKKAVFIFLILSFSFAFIYCQGLTTTTFFKSFTSLVFNIYLKKYIAYVPEMVCCAQYTFL